MRYWCCLLVAVFAVLALPAEEAWSGEATVRAGFSIGSKQIIGLYVERLENDTGVRAQMGYLIHAVSISCSAVRYFTGGEDRPYVGFGLIRHIRNRHLEGDTLLSIPLGYDIKITDDHYIAPELIPAVSFTPLREKETGGKPFSEYILPLPSIAYKYCF